jgi:F-type H+-transporting ATPase subunit epsilon
MADRTFTVDIVTPERVLLRDEAVSLTAPGVEGSFGILANHAPMLAELGIGELRYRRADGREQFLAVGGGFLQVFNNEVSVLAEAAERAEEIDVDRARLARERARTALSAAEGGYDTNQAAYERAANRLFVAERR